MPSKPIITDFEEVFLPEDNLSNGQDDASLEELGSVFNRLMNRQNNAPESPQDEGQNDSNSETADEFAGNFPESSPPQRETAGSAEAAATLDDGECPLTPESIFEALLFVGGEENGCVTAEQVCNLLPGVSEEEAAAMADAIAQRWEEDARPYYLERKGDSWRMSLKETFAPIRELFYSAVREFELTQSANNVLAIVAYQQPVTAQQISQTIGIDRPTSILNQLVKRNLLQVEKRVTGEKKVNLYRTTQRFLELYNLESLDDLPTLDDI